MLLAALLLISAEPRFSVTKLNVFGEVSSVTPADFDGDGQLDLLVVHRRGTVRNGQRTFALFWNDKGRFAPKADLVFNVPEDACAFDVADVDENKGAEIVYVTHEGVSALSFRDRERRAAMVLTREPTLFLHADKDALMRLKIAQALSGQGVELLVPVTDALAIYKRSGGSWFAVSKVSTRLATVDLRKGFRGVDDRHLESFDLKIDFPDVHAIDASGDGLKDLVFTDGDRVAIFEQAPGLGFSKEPTFQRDFAIASEQELDEGFTQTTTLVRDVDKDGLADLLITKQVSQGITSGSSTTYLFLGQPNGFSKNAEQTITSDGVGGTVSQLIDLTGDERPELLLPSVKMGVLAIIRALTTQTVKVAVFVHPFDAAKRRFADKPIAERELTFKFSLSGKSDFQAIDVRGDYNGDKLRDLALGTTGGDLALFLGTGGGTLIAENEAEKVKINARGILTPIDLDGDKKDEIVLFYPNTKEERGNVVVLFNKGPW